MGITAETSKGKITSKNEKEQKMPVLGIEPRVVPTDAPHHYSMAGPTQ